MIGAGYDAAAKWTPVPDWRSAVLDREGWTARPVPGLHLTLVSGDPARFDGLAAMPEAGLWGIATAERARLRVARDRALLVCADPLPLGTGWRDGFALSPASDAFAVFELAGAGMRDVVAEAVSADLDAGSPSAATLFAGVSALLHRTAPDTARLFVDAPLGAYVWRWLEMRVG